MKRNEINKAQSVSALCIKYSPQVISQQQNGHPNFQLVNMPEVVKAPKRPQPKTRLPSGLKLQLHRKKICISQLYPKTADYKNMTSKCASFVVVNRLFCWTVLRFKIKRICFLIYVHYFLNLYIMLLVYLFHMKYFAHIIKFILLFLCRYKTSLPKAG